MDNSNVKPGEHLDPGDAIARVLPAAGSGASAGTVRTSSRSARTMAGIPIPLWRLRAIADPRDTRWQGRVIHADTIVRAPSAAMARVVASSLDRHPDAVRRGNESLSFRSGFADEKLYWATRLDEAGAAALRAPGGKDAQRCAVLATEAAD